MAVFVEAGRGRRKWEARKSISGAVRGSPGRAVEAGIRGIELSCISVIRLDEWQQSQDIHPRLKNHYSVDSLITTDVTGSITDVDGCFMAQCNQIFIGMITMQYQAKQVSTSAILTYKYYVSYKVCGNKIRCIY